MLLEVSSFLGKRPGMPEMAAWSALHVGRRKPLDYQGIRRAVAAWQPFAGFIYFHLLLSRIREAGWLESKEAQTLSPGETPHRACAEGVLEVARPQQYGCANEHAACHS
jgi:hypothetical protein